MAKPYLISTCKPHHIQLSAKQTRWCWWLRPPAWSQVRISYQYSQPPVCVVRAQHFVIRVILGRNQRRSQSFLLNSPVWCFYECFSFPLQEKNKGFQQRQRTLQCASGRCCQVLPSRAEPRAGSNLGGSRQECSGSIWAHREILTAHTFFCSERKINNPESMRFFSLY